MTHVTANIKPNIIPQRNAQSTSADYMKSETPQNSRELTENMPFLFSPNPKHTNTPRV